MNEITPTILHTLPLDLGDRSYQILIGTGLLPRLGEEAGEVFPSSARIAVVTNETVAPLYLATALRSLEASGYRTLPIILPDGESYKEWQSLNQIFDALLAARFERGSAILALGGGVIGDMAGFAAACYQRGIPYLQVPTTLLSQVDSSVGGKTGINHPLGKNMIGAFYQPKRVVIDLTTLTTLDPRQLRAGLAEVIKYGIIRDETLFSFVEEHLEAILGLDYPILAQLIHRCCAIKAEVVAADEQEKGLRALLNLGHTFGHAIETVTHYDQFLHGEAIAIGMVMAADLSQRLGLCSRQTVERIRTLLRRAELPVTIPDLSVTELLEAMSRDKKVAAGQLRFVLIETIGQARLNVTPPSEAVVATLAACSEAFMCCRPGG